jgi:hypothetical protein
MFEGYNNKILREVEFSFLQNIHLSVSLEICRRVLGEQFSFLIVGSVAKCIFDGEDFSDKKDLDFVVLDANKKPIKIRHLDKTMPAVNGDDLSEKFISYYNGKVYNITYNNSKDSCYNLCDNTLYYADRFVKEGIHPPAYWYYCQTKPLKQKVDLTPIILFSDFILYNEKYSEDYVLFLNDVVDHWVLQHGDFLISDMPKYLYAYGLLDNLNDKTVLPNGLNRNCYDLFTQYLKEKEFPKKEVTHRDIIEIQAKATICL